MSVSFACGVGGLVYGILVRMYAGRWDALWFQGAGALLAFSVVLYAAVRRARQHQRDF